MSEAVRLVIWDLDETFWKGTVSEGGIQEYVQERHDLVIELSRRGIVNSICSKNDPAVVLPILEAHGILEYFVLPSINWEAKGPRLKRLVELFQLRPETVLFIDDNPNNRAEAVALVPGIQVESEACIAHLRADPRLRGQDDAGLTRLAHYRLLEARHRDAARSGGSNEDFLRSCNIRVMIDYDVAGHVDRAVELINRTNQLNFTKRRLPEQPDAARAELLAEVRQFGRVSGLIKVADKYGDYGYVGFFLTVTTRSQLATGAANHRLVHFCFSCRTLGMLIEQWTYEHLGRPELEVVGEVLTDLKVPRQIDWVTQVGSLTDGAPTTPPIAERIVVYGGCEAHIVGVYLGAHAPAVTTIGNYSANGVFVRAGLVDVMLDICDRRGAAFEREAEVLGLPLENEAVDLFAETGQSTVYVLNFNADAYGCGRIRHKTHGWLFSLVPERPAGVNFLTLSEAEMRAHLEDPGAHYSAPQQEHLLQVYRHVRAHYEPVEQPRAAAVARSLATVIERIPQGSTLILVVPAEEWRPRYPASDVERRPDVERYAGLVRRVARARPFVGVVSFAEVIRGADELLDADHLAREVYLRFARRVAEVAAGLRPKGAADQRAAGILEGRSLLEEWVDADTVEELFQLILGRSVNDDAYKARVDLEHTLRFWIGALLESEEFAQRFAERLAAQRERADR